MAQDKRWDMETAARLLQYGATGKAVAEAVGCLPSEISRHKDTLLSMVVDPLTQNEADKLLRKWKPAPLPPQQIEETQTAPVRQTNIGPGSEAPMPDPEESKPVSRPMELEKSTLPIRKEPNIRVDISIGKGKVHLEAENARVLETLINMLVAMGGCE